MTDHPLICNRSIRCAICGGLGVVGHDVDCEKCGGIGYILPGKDRDPETFEEAVAAIVVASMSLLDTIVAFGTSADDRGGTLNTIIVAAMAAVVWLAVIAAVLVALKTFGWA